MTLANEAESEGDVATVAVVVVVTGSAGEAAGTTIIGVCAWLRPIASAIGRSKKRRVNLRFISGSGLRKFARCERPRQRLRVWFRS